MFRRWWIGPVGWLVQDPQPLAEPVQMKGRLMLFEVELGETEAQRHKGTESLNRRQRSERSQGNGLTRTGTE